MGINPQNLASDQNILKKVLAHRADRNASKFLKKELALPKANDDSMKGKIMNKFQGQQKNFTKMKAPQLGMFS